jgi:hypothetical protein
LSKTFSPNRYNKPFLPQLGATRIVNGLSATPIYDSIQDFAAAYKKNANTIISKLNKSANLNSRPL